MYLASYVVKSLSRTDIVARRRNRLTIANGDAGSWGGNRGRATLAGTSLTAACNQILSHR
jgi:hypothetical protein